MIFYILQEASQRTAVHKNGTKAENDHDPGNNLQSDLSTDKVVRNEHGTDLGVQNGHGPAIIEKENTIETHSKFVSFAEPSKTEER